MFDKLQLQVHILLNTKKQVLFTCLGEFNKLYSLINFFDKNCSLELKGIKDRVNYHLSAGSGENKYYAVLINEIDESTAIDIEKALNVVETAQHVIDNFEQYKDNIGKVKEQLGFKELQHPRIQEIKEEIEGTVKPKRKYNKKK